MRLDDLCCENADIGEPNGGRGCRDGGGALVDGAIEIVANSLIVIGGLFGVEIVREESSEPMLTC